MLKPGDTIGVIAPSRPIQNIKNEIEAGIKMLEDLGFKVKRSKNLEKKFYYSAGTAKERVSDIHDMFADGEIKAIICATGGSSANQLLELIDWELIRNNPKIFIGYSDISILLLSIFKKTGLTTFYGPTVFELPMLTPGAKEFLLDILSGENKKFTYPSEQKILRPGRADGKLVGGLLSRINSLHGTMDMPNLDGTILFWEDVNSSPAMIDFNLQTMRLQGVFGKIKGMVIGHLSECIDKKYPEDNCSIEDIIIDRTEGFDFPIIKVEYFGHGIDTFYTLPIGANAKINTDENLFSVALE